MQSSCLQLVKQIKLRIFEMLSVRRERILLGENIFKNSFMVFKKTSFLQSILYLHFGENNTP